MIGRGGSSLKNKNVLPVLGKPLLHYPAVAAQGSKYIGRCFTSSDDTLILETAEQDGFKPIMRPDELASDTAQSSDAVFHALDVIESESPVKYLVLLHANVGTITSAMIDDCLSILMENPELSSVIPAHYHDEYHPYRASFINGDGLLDPVLPPGGKVSANRQDLPKAVFFDHSFWAINLDVVRSEGLGDGPWPCMGKTIRPYIGEGCFDVHTLEDIARTEEWLRTHAE
ncbi:cytidylyltransferase domain-containing protein [Rubritalea spongiae]|uniref:Cytidylyltransferase domain-containing protein n=2 Tax=Rubritalea spongiae TaxID=430797 RepID=A0ABW5E0Y3_9BACT